MSLRVLDYLYIFLVIAFTVYGQIILKWRVNLVGEAPAELIGKFRFILSLLLDPGIISSFLAAFLASIAWMLAMTKFELSYAYPFMALNFVLVLLLSSFLFGDSITLQKVIGVLVIGIGVFISCK